MSNATRMTSEIEIAVMIDSVKKLEERMTEFANKYVTVFNFAEKNAIYNVLLNINDVDVSLHTLLGDIHEANTSD